VNGSAKRGGSAGKKKPKKGGKAEKSRKKVDMFSSSSEMARKRETGRKWDENHLPRKIRDEARKCRTRPGISLIDADGMVRFHGGKTATNGMSKSVRQLLSKPDEAANNVAYGLNVNRIIFRCQEIRRLLRWEF
jgi:hypothetical protein